MANPQSPGRDTLTRSLLANQVKERLLESILDGSYPPDSRIVETAIAKELGDQSGSRPRGSARSRSAWGSSRSRPSAGRGSAGSTPAELLGAYIVRSTLEVLGARLACPG